MTTHLTDRPRPALAAQLRTAQLPPYGTKLVLAVAALAGVGVWLQQDNRFLGLLTAWLVCFAIPAWSYVVEGSRKATDRLVTVLVTSAFAIALFPLFSIMYEVLSRGASALGIDFLTFSMRNVIGARVVASTTR